MKTQNPNHIVESMVGKNCRLDRRINVTEDYNTLIGNIPEEWKVMLQLGEVDENPGNARESGLRDLFNLGKSKLTCKDIYKRYICIYQWSGKNQFQIV